MAERTQVLPRTPGAMEPIGLQSVPLRPAVTPPSAAPLVVDDRPARPQRSSPDPFYRTDRYRLVTPYSWDPDPSRS